MIHSIHPVVVCTYLGGVIHIIQVNHDSILNADPLPRCVEDTRDDSFII